MEASKSFDDYQESKTNKTESSIISPIAAEERSSTKHDEIPIQYMKGWRLHLLTIGLGLSFFLSALDITIVSTSLASITDALKSFDQSAWIISSYLTTYFSFVIVWAKLSDIFGRKWFLVITLAMFVVFSGACAAAQTIIQLIIFRAFQGIGGAGIYALIPIITSEMVPSSQYGGYNGLFGSVIGISFLLGPIIGGAINDNTSWRWIFLINVPLGCMAVFLIILAMPSNFPHKDSRPSSRQQSYLKRCFQRVDFPGFLLFLAVCLLLVFALQEAGTTYLWSSAIIITFFALSGVLWILFFAWQRNISRRVTICEAVFPWKFVKNRVLMGIFLNALLSGVPFTAMIIELPQKFQAVSDISPLSSGVRLLPFSLLCAVSSALSGVFTSSLKIPPIYVITAGGILQTLGLALLYTMPISLQIPASEYGFEALAGFGVGLSLTTLLGLAPFVVDKSDRAVALGAVTQLRVLGGTIGIATCTNLLNNHVKSSLSLILLPEQLNDLLQSTLVVKTLDPAMQIQVKTVFDQGYNLQTCAILGFTVAEFLAILLMWERKPRAGWS